jgi:hypothetical protein
MEVLENNSDVFWHKYGNYIIYCCTICHLWNGHKNNHWEKYSKDGSLEYEYYGFEEDLIRYLKLKAFW